MFGNKNEITTPYEINCLFYASDSEKTSIMQRFYRILMSAQAREIRQIKTNQQTTNRIAENEVIN